MARQMEPLDDDLEDFFGRLSQAVAGLIGAGRVAFFLLVGNELRLQQRTFGIAPESGQALQALPCHREGDSLAEQIVFGRATFRATLGAGVEDLQPYRSWLEVIQAYDSVAVPWAIGDQSLGLVAAYNSSARIGFTDADEWVLQVAVATAALVWQQRQLQLSLVRVKAAENQQIRAEADKATELEEMKRRILNLAAHELRGPIAVIRGYISMLAEGSLDEAHLRRILPILTAKTGQMDALVTQMLEVARLDEGHLELQRARVELGAVVRDTVDVAALLAPPGINIFLERPPDPVIVEGDPDRIATIVSNLVDNAIKYSPDGGSILCALGIDPGRAFVRVKDEGVGIAPAHAQHLFSRFSRIVTPETSHIPGTGLGLHLSRELARLHGGDITVESELGKGSTFTLWLPREGSAPA